MVISSYCIVSSSYIQLLGLVANLPVQPVALVQALRLLQSLKMVHDLRVHVPGVPVVHRQAVLILQEMMIRRKRKRVEVIVVHLHPDHVSVCL